MAIVLIAEIGEIISTLKEGYDLSDLVAEFSAKMDAKDYAGARDLALKELEHKVLDPTPYGQFKKLVSLLESVMAVPDREPVTFTVTFRNNTAHELVGRIFDHQDGTGNACWVGSLAPGADTGGLTIHGRYEGRPGEVGWQFEGFPDGHNANVASGEIDLYPDMSGTP